MMPLGGDEFGQAGDEHVFDANSSGFFSSTRSEYSPVLQCFSAAVLQCCSASVLLTQSHTTQVYYKSINLKVSYVYTS